ncbi:hypothetical protein HQN89_20945 [Paenibacillus frigoriresistens]|uniref:hypothetical protein n=1 Tax=Paenibacillus alginolyticus TaxID=59839 RepID=UPI001565C688|nr:hypothetical protein [Paenibacillus frigoriresistens]NRF93419.1 hypothetical protein [Paenibacillus frigoriresistens]
MNYWLKKIKYRTANHFPLPQTEEQQRNKELFINTLSDAIIHFTNGSTSSKNREAVNENGSN